MSIVNDAKKERVIHLNMRTKNSNLYEDTYISFNILKQIRMADDGVRMFDKFQFFEDNEKSGGYVMLMDAV